MQSPLSKLSKLQAKVNLEKSQAVFPAVSVGMLFLNNPFTQHWAPMHSQMGTCIRLNMLLSNKG